MKRKKRGLRLQLVVGYLIIGMFAGCGHGREKGEQNEEQKAMGGYIGSKACDAAEASSGTNFKASAQKKETVVVVDNGQKEKETEMIMGEVEESAAIAVELLEEEESRVEENVAEAQPESNDLQNSEPVVEESGSVDEASTLYYLTEADKEQVLAQLITLGESYGLTYHPEITEGETWDSPTPIYEEELVLGREHVMSAMVEYTEGAFVLMQLEACQGFALSIKEQPHTMTDAYYEVYVYWI